jgi:uncharacterized protein with GYD domain
MLSRFSPGGVKILKQNPDGLLAVSKVVESLGARVLMQYVLLGAYDFLLVLEAPDAETVARVAVELGMRGTASYETLTAIPVEAFIATLKKG